MQTYSRSTTPHAPDKVIKERRSSNVVFYRSSSSNWSDDSINHNGDSNNANREHSPELITNTDNVLSTVVLDVVLSNNHTILKQHVIRRSSENTNDNNVSSLEKWRARHRTPLRESNRANNETNLITTSKDITNAKHKFKETEKVNKELEVQVESKDHNTEEEKGVKRSISARFNKIDYNNIIPNRNESTPKQKRAGSAILSRNSATREEHLALMATLPYSVRRGLSWHSSYHERRTHSNKSIQANATTLQRTKQDNVPQEKYCKLPFSSEPQQLVEKTEEPMYITPSVIEKVKVVVQTASSSVSTKQQKRSSLPSSVERKKMNRSPSVNKNTINRESKIKLEKRLSNLKRAVSLSRWQQHVPLTSNEREDRAAPLSVSPYRLNTSEHRTQNKIEITSGSNNRNNLEDQQKEENNVHNEINEKRKRDISANMKRNLSAKPRTPTPLSKTSSQSSLQKNNKLGNKIEYSNSKMRRKKSSNAQMECERELKYEELITKDNNINNNNKQEKAEKLNNNVYEKDMAVLNRKNESRRGSNGSNGSRDSDRHGRERFTRSSTPPSRMLYEQSQEKCTNTNKTKDNYNTVNNNVNNIKITTESMEEKVNLSRNTQTTTQAFKLTGKSVTETDSKLVPLPVKATMNEKDSCVANIITSPSSSSHYTTSCSYSYSSSSSSSSSSSAESYTTSSSSVSKLSKPSPFTKALLDEELNKVNQEEEKDKMHHVEDKAINTENENNITCENEVITVIGGGNVNDEKQEESNQESKADNVELEQVEKEEQNELPHEKNKTQKKKSPIYSWLNTPVRDSNEETDSSSRQTITTTANSSNKNSENSENATESSKTNREINVHENTSEASQLIQNENSGVNDNNNKSNENSPSDDRKSRFSFFTSELHDTNTNTILSLTKEEEEEQEESSSQTVNSHKDEINSVNKSLEHICNNDITNSTGNSHTNSNTFGLSSNETISNSISFSISNINNESKSTQGESSKLQSTQNNKGKTHSASRSRSSNNNSYSSHHHRSSHHPHLTRRQIFIANRVDSLHVPHWAKRTLFDLFDFFTRARFYFVVLIVFALVYTYARTNAFNEVASTFTVAEENRPGLTFLYRYNHNNTHLPRKHPVVIIPGFITGALELWEANLPCMQEQSFITSGFRQRMFGPQMIYLILRNPQCWLDVFSTNKETGLDQDGVRVRADLGFTSVDYFVPGYWVWAKVLVNLADIGYDPQSMSVISYDWRLSPDKCQERDGLYYNIRNTIKFMAQKNKQRVVLISHSYGTNVALSFFKWAEEREHGFMSKYVAYYVNVGGTTLGVPKALSALLLGDAKDTISIPAPARKMLDTFISQAARYNFTRTWSSLIAMLPRGCDKISTHGVLTLPNGTILNSKEAAQLVRDQCQLTNHTDCVNEINKFTRTSDNLPTLPQSANTTVMCLYGVNKYAESGYVLSGDMKALQTNTSVSSTQSKVDHGVYYDNGDGTVPLLSLSYMCRADNGWRQNVERIVTVEFLHNESIMSALNLRGSSVSGDHVDILGNYELIDTLLKIVSGVDELGAQRENDIVSYKDVLSNKTIELHRRVETRLYSDVDDRIAKEAQTCLRKPNAPIKPKDSIDKNPFM